MARKKKDELEEALKQAKTGPYMVAIWTVREDQLRLFRKADNFPLLDLPTAIKLLEDNLKPETPVLPDQQDNTPPS